MSDINKGFAFLHKAKNKKLLIISHGSIIERANKTISSLPKNIKNSIELVDLIQSKPFPKKLANHINKFKNILTIDEQTISGSLGSIIKEVISKKYIFFSLA